jgi:hypothetical protein
VRFEVFTAGGRTMLFFWVLAPCRLVGSYQRFGETTVSIFRAEVAMLGNGGREEGKPEGSGPIRDVE